MKRGNSMSLEEIVINADSYAQTEIKKYNLPAPLHYNLSYKKAIEIAHNNNANIELVKIGVALMDLKLGEAFKKGMLAKHVSMSRDASIEFLSDKIGQDDLDIIINCLEAHHGTVPYKYVEAEICANADCYRFIHPSGVFFYLSNLGKRSLLPSELFIQAKSKLDEKWAIVSLDSVRMELQDYYIKFSQFFDDALSMIIEDK